MRDNWNARQRRREVSQLSQLDRQIQKEKGAGKRAANREERPQEEGSW
jgi:hypothetical protein